MYYLLSIYTYNSVWYIFKRFENQMEFLFMCFTPYQLITAMYYSYVFPNVNKTLIYMDYSDYKIEQRFYLKYFDSVVYVPSYINDNILIKQFKK